jgi:hypothetical protein
VKGIDATRVDRLVRLYVVAVPGARDMYAVRVRRRFRAIRELLTSSDKLASAAGRAAKSAATEAFDRGGNKLDAERAAIAVVDAFPYPQQGGWRELDGAGRFGGKNPSVAGRAAAPGNGSSVRAASHGQS